MTSLSKARNHGFSLLEVLISVAIVSFGLLALAALQLSLVRASAASRTQTVAIALAKEKIEQLRSFQTPAQYLAISSEACPGTAGCSISQGGVSFSRSTTVVRYTFDKTSGAYVSTVANTTAPLLARDLKRVGVTVGWTDSTGQAQAISMEDVVDGLDPSDSAKLVKFASAAGPRKLQEIIPNPGLDTMVIPIALGGDVSSAATNPKPNVVKGVNTVETSFDVMTYAGLANASTVTAQAKVETLIDGCTCNYAAAPATTVRGMRPTYWDGTRYTSPVPVPDVGGYSPPAGVDSASVASQSPRCTICCRDHHDPVGTTGATFSPTKVVTSAGVVTIAHPHYFDKAALTPAVSGTYKEACRIIRVDGVFSVASDLSNDYFALLATGDGTTAATPNPDSTSVQGAPAVAGGAIARYQKFVLDYMGGRFTTPTPSVGSEQATYNTVGTPYTLAASAPYVLDNPVSISIALKDLTGKWLHSRGLYVDYLEKEATDAITAAKADTACNASASALSACVLKLLPFTSINLTEIADWAPLSGPLTVTNNDYSQSTAQPLPVRGKVTTSATAAATVDATAKARKSNSGLLDLSFDAISAADAVTINDNQSFLIGGGSGSGTGSASFFVNLTMPTGFAGTPNVSYVTGAQPSAGCGTGTPVTNQTCNVQNGTASEGLGIANTMAIVVGGYNRQNDLGTSTANVTGCTGTGNATGFAVLNTGSTAHNRRECLNYGVTTATNSPTGGVATIQSPPTFPGLQSETTRISFPLINPSDTISVGMQLESSSEQPAASCTYTCEQAQGGACKANKATYFTVVYNACP